MKGESESVSFLSPVKTRSTYGPTIVAIAQGPFAWRFIKTVTSFTDLLIEDVLRKKESSLQDTFPSYPFLGFYQKHPSAHTHYPRSSRCVPCEPHGSADAVDTYSVNSI